MPVTRGNRVPIPENEIRGGIRKRKESNGEVHHDPTQNHMGQNFPTHPQKFESSQPHHFEETEVIMEENIVIQGESEEVVDSSGMQYHQVENTPKSYTEESQDAPNLAPETEESPDGATEEKAPDMMEEPLEEPEFSGPPRLDLESGPGQPESEPPPSQEDMPEEAVVVIEKDGRPVTISGPVSVDEHGRRVIQLPPGEYEALTGGLDEDQLILESTNIVDDSMIPPDLRTVEFNFLDNKNICCGLCGEIVPYDTLMSDHLPNQHPEILGDGSSMQMEEIPYEEWLREKLRVEKRAIESGFKLTSYEAPARVHRSANRPQRRVSQIRVNPQEMSISQLDSALKKKMVEKMGRKVPVTLVDKQHARCGLCNAVVSLNRKFEVIHLVRHFNAWHPSTHKCAGTWHHRPPTKQGIKPLSMHDFAVIDSNNATPDNLQCIWCGMFMDCDSLAMHFDEVHPDEIEVPKCNLCLQELVLNARMQEKYGDDFEITLPDEHHIRCGKYGNNFSSEGALERGIERKLAKGVEAEMGSDYDVDEDEDMGLDDGDDAGPEAFLNSRMSLGKRKKPKRQFIMPALRQAAPIDSEYVEPVTECHWKCKICNDDIMAAVISAGAIKHFRSKHPELLDNMQYELCKARLERVSDGSMEFVHPALIECLLCNMTYNLHRPYNMCRAIRHLKSKHPNLMPEYSGIGAGPRPSGIPSTSKQSAPKIPRRALPTIQTIASAGAVPGISADGDGIQLAMVNSLEALKEYGIDISKMEGAEAEDGDQVYVLMPEGVELDPETAADLARVAAEGGTFDNRNFRVVENDSGQIVGDGNEATVSQEPLTNYAATTATSSAAPNAENPSTRVFTVALGKDSNGGLDPTVGALDPLGTPDMLQKSEVAKSAELKNQLTRNEPLPEPVINQVPPMPDLLSND